MGFKILTTPKAHLDTIEAIEWYNKQAPGLGKRFYQALQRQYKTLRQNPYFQMRYEDVRCLPLKTFPYMIHFIVKQQQVVILGVIGTHRDPQIWKEHFNQ